jgi:hypothetical protein
VHRIRAPPAPTRADRVDRRQRLLHRDGSRGSHPGGHPRPLDPHGCPSCCSGDSSADCSARVPSWLWGASSSS